METTPKISPTAIFQGLWVTLKNFILSIFLLDKPTIQYPKEKRHYSERFRGTHILTQRDDGSVKCVACYMCATICPADCITIVAGEYTEKKEYSLGKTIDKYPIKFEIDMLRCVFCGLCVDACPEEAIIMSQDYEMAVYTREETVYSKVNLMDRPALKKFGLGYRPRYPISAKTTGVTGVTN